MKSEFLNLFMLTRLEAYYQIQLEMLCHISARLELIDRDEDSVSQLSRVVIEQKASEFDSIFRALYESNRDSFAQMLQVPLPGSDSKEFDELVKLLSSRIQPLS